MPGFNLNNSIMKCCICNNSKSGEFLIIDNKKYHYCCITELSKRKDNFDILEKNLVASIYSINKKLKERDYTPEKYINDYREVRLRAIRMKCKELLKILLDD
jgi:hypothetical protein|nr:MAG TPA: hypothetical protein [Inoviridae sp.]